MPVCSYICRCGRIYDDHEFCRVEGCVGGIDRAYQQIRRRYQQAFPPRKIGTPPALPLV